MPNKFEAKTIKRKLSVIGHDNALVLIICKKKTKKYAASWQYEYDYKTIGLSPIESNFFCMLIYLYIYTYMIKPDQFIYQCSQIIYFMYIQKSHIHSQIRRCVTDEFGDHSLKPNQMQSHDVFHQPEDGYIMNTIGKDSQRFLSLHSFFLSKQQQHIMQCFYIIYTHQSIYCCSACAIVGQFIWNLFYIMNKLVKANDFKLLLMN